MFVKMLQEVGFLTVLPAVAIVLCTILFLRRNKKFIKDVPIAVKNERLFSFQPESLIDCQDINDLNDVFELHQPDECNADCLNLAKINYYNFLNNENIKNEAEKCIRSNGVGSCGPRGFYGTIDIHLDLESKLAEFMGMEETVLYSYGFSTISSAIGAYCKKSDILFCDEKINFAAVQGIIAAKSKVVYFKHNDVEDLEIILKEYQNKEKKKNQLYRKFLIVEGIYKNTGTICPLPQLIELRRKYKLRMFIDESVSFGVLGKTGRGVTEHFNVDTSDVDMIMGSLEGSIGSIGGFCVGASVVIEHQRLSGLGYCFSASLPPFLSRISINVLDMFENDPSMFQKLQSISTTIDEELQMLSKYEVMSDPLSPLKVITTKNKENCKEKIEKIHSYCTQQNLHLNFSENTLSFNVNITMGKKEIDKIVTILKESSQIIEN